MSRTIDERIVEMRFDNKQFESGAQESINTLSKLKSALNFTDAARSFDTLDQKAKSVSLDGLISGVQTLERRFSTFGIVGMRIIENITDGLVHKLAKGINFVSSTIVSGGIKRAMNIENAHFQLQALLKDEQKVQEVMNDAMVSVDGTAYAYDEAAKAASQFAASGIQSGEQMRSSLKAIVGVAAMTNSQFESIARIFTTVAGNGRLMGDQLLQLSSRGLNAASTLAEFVNGVNDGSKQTSDNVKAAVKEISHGLNVTEGDIRDFVSKGQISFDIFSAAMVEAFGDSAERANETFTGAFSNMKSALARIGAGFVSPLVEQNSQVIKLFNALRIKINEVKKALVFDESIGNVQALSKQFTDSVLAMSKSVASFVEEADVSKPIDIFYHSIESIKNISKGLLSVLKPIKSAFNEAFSDFSINSIVELSSKIELLTSKLKLSNENSRNLHDAFKGIFDVAKLLVDGFQALLLAIIPVNKPISSLGDLLFGLSGHIGRALSSFTEWIRQSPIIAKSYDIISEGISSASHGIGSFIDYISNLIHKISELPAVQNVLSALNKTFGAMGDILDSLSLRYEPFEMFFSTIFNMFQKAGSITVKIIDGMAYAISSLLGAITGALGKGDFNGFIDILNAGLFTTLAVQMRKILTHVDRSVKSAGGLLRNINGILKGVRKSLIAFQDSIKAEVLKKIAVAIAILAGSLVTLSLIDSAKLTASLSAITVLFLDLFGTMALFDKVVGKSKGTRLVNLSTSLITLSTSIVILSVALKKISDVDTDKLMNSMISITALIGEMTAVSIILSKYGGKVKTGVLSIIAFTSSIYILSSAVAKLGQLDLNALTKGLTSVGVLLGELSLFMVTAKFGKFNPIQATSIVILAEALKILETAVRAYGSLNVDAIIKGLTSVGVLLTEISLFSFATGKADHIIASATSLILMAKAIDILKTPMIAMGNMSLANIGKGLLSIGGALTEITVALKFMPKNVISIGVGLIAVSESLKMLSESLVILGDMTWDEIARGLTALGGSLGILSIGLNTMKGTLAASAAILTMSAALRVFVPSLKTLGEMSFGAIATGLLALGASFATVGAAGVLLGPVTPSILALSGALAVLSVSIGIAGAGILALSTGLAGLAGATVASVSAAIGSLKILFVGVLDIIADSGAAIGRAVKTIVLTACDVLKNCVPEIADTALSVISEVLKSLANYTPEIVDSLLKFIIGIIDTLAKDIPEVVESVMNLVAQMFAAITQALKGLDKNVLLDAISGVAILATMMLSLSALKALAPGAAAGIVSMGLIIGELSILLAAIGALSQIPGLNWLIGEGGDLLENIGNSIGRFVGGIIGGIAEGVTSSFPKIADDLSGFMNNLKPFIEGASQLDSNILDGVNTLAKTILLLTASDILNGLTAWLTGGNSLSKFGQELAAFGEPFATFSEQIKNVDPTVVTASANAAKVLADMADSLPNSGGLAAKIMGDNKLSDFGKELASFGPHLSNYAKSVVDINPEAVTASANAAKVLADMADSLPDSGGLASKIFGDNRLSDFGKELSAFAPHLAVYSSSIAGVNPEAVTASANAAKVLADMASILPNSGGLAAKIMGDNKLADFGKELASFGPHFSKYATSVSGIDSNVVITSANAAKALSELSNGLPNSGGIISWFSGDNDLSSFGKNLSKFGNGLASYYQSIAGIDTILFDSVTKEISKLISIAQNVASVDGGALETFINSFKHMGVEGINQFINAFNNSGSNVENAIQSLINIAVTVVNEGATQLAKVSKDMGITITTSIADAIDSNVPNVLNSVTNLSHMIILTLDSELPGSEFSSIAQRSMDSLSDTIQSNTGSLVSTSQYVSDNIVNSFTNVLTESTFSNIGGNACQGLSNGIESEQGNVENSAINVSYAGINAFSNNFTSNELYWVGAYAAQGLANGIASQVGSIANSAINAASVAISSARQTLQVHSPSRVFFKIGEFVSLGLANGITKLTNKVGKAGDNLADNAISHVTDAISVLKDLINSGEFDTDLTLTPVVNLSGVKSGIAEISSMFKSKSFDMMPAINQASSINAMRYNYRGIDKEPKVVINNDIIVDAINDLRSDISVLKDNLNNLQIVMDTGALVGAITDPMDVSLGMQQKYRERGI